MNTTRGAEVSITEGLSLSAGIVSGNTTREITVNLGWLTLVGLAVAVCPLPGARLVSKGIILLDLLI